GADMPAETTRLAVVFTGQRTPAHWTGTAPTLDVWDLKGQIEEIAAAMGITNVRLGGDEATRIGASVASVVSDSAVFSGATAEAEILGGRLRKDYIDAPAWAGEIF